MFKAFYEKGINIKFRVYRNKLYFTIVFNKNQNAYYFVLTNVWTAICIEPLRKVLKNFKQKLHIWIC